MSADSEKDNLRCVLPTCRARHSRNFCWNKLRIFWNTCCCFFRLLRHVEKCRPADEQSFSLSALIDFFPCKTFVNKARSKQDLSWRIKSLFWRCTSKYNRRRLLRTSSARSACPYYPAVPNNCDCFRGHSGGHTQSWEHFCFYQLRSLLKLSSYFFRLTAICPQLQDTPC